MLTLSEAAHLLVSNPTSQKWTSSGIAPVGRTPSYMNGNLLSSITSGRSTQLKINRNLSIEWKVDHEPIDPHLYREVEGRKQIPVMSGIDAHWVTVTLKSNDDVVDELRIFFTTDGRYLPLSELDDDGKEFVYEYVILIANILEGLTFTPSPKTVEPILYFFTNMNYILTVAGGQVLIDGYATELLPYWGAKSWTPEL